MAPQRERVSFMIERDDLFGSGSPVEKLVDELDSLFPAFLPLPTNSIEEIMFRAGQRSVVEYIRDKLER
jgi:hypothetical protein